MAMQSRRDLYQAHRLMTQRASLALLRGEPDVPDQPLRRMNVSTFAGILVAVIVAGIFGIWGLLFHGAPSLQNLQGSLIVDKQTGQNYIFCGNNGKFLCPVVNHASGLLALQNPNVQIQNVNQSSLAGYPRGPEYGIANLPDLPSKSLLVHQPWSACTRTRSGVANAPNGTKTTTVVAGGFQPGGQSLGSTGLFLATTTSSAASTTSSGQEWVIGNSERWPIEANTAGPVLGAAPVSVPMDWLNALGQGSAFQAPFIAGRGTPVTGPAGQTEAGQLFKTVVGANTHYYVIQQNGRLSSISQTQESLLALEKNVAAPALVNPSQVNGLVSGQLPDNGLPATDTNTVHVAQSDPLCVVLTGPGQSLSTQVEVGGQMPSGGTQTGAATGSSLVVNQVFLPGGKGALVQVAGSAISYLLVTGTHRYSMAGTSVPGFLGYQLSEAVRLPAGFVDMFPPGPGLNPAQANQPLSASTGNGGLQPGNGG